MIEILRPGIQTTVQDLGRPGLAHLGIGRGGALDIPALMQANALLCNAPDSAGLEIVVGPVALRLLRSGWLALCGADFGATLDNVPLRHGWRTPFVSGQVLKLQGARHGMRTYLAIDGGIACKPVLGGRSTDLGAHFGGHLGRALRKGDRLALGPPQPAGLLRRQLGSRQRLPQLPIRILPGPDYDSLDAKSRQALVNGIWQISAQGNRMGARLQGPALSRTQGDQILSRGVLPGVIQVPPDGQPIVLLADAQTTGGYPVMAVVIEADLWQFAQFQPGSEIRFALCSLAEALQAQRQWQQQHYRLERSIHERC